MNTVVYTRDEYKFDELPEEAKENAIEKYREDNLDYYDWWDCVYEDAKEIGKLMGIEIDNIYFRGFWSQGDGACFEGSFSYETGCFKNVKAYAPLDKELHRIAKRWSIVQRPSFYQLNGNVKQSGHYSHEYCTDIKVYGDGDLCTFYVDTDTEDAVAEVLRDFMRWIYKQLHAQYDYLQSDECITETIECNDYTFDEYGNII